MAINDSIQNVLNFLSNLPFNEDTLKEDCIAVRYLHIPEIDKKVEEFKQMRLWEVNNFLTVLDYPQRNEFFDYMQYNVYLPFKHSRNVEAEAILFGYNITISSMYLIELIDKFLTPEQREKYGKRIETYIHHQSINLYTITRSRFQGHKDNVFPQSDQQICDEMFQAYLRRKEYKSLWVDSVYIGHYAELYVYNYLSSLPNLDVIWVSRYIGDGYGYDMMTYDKNTGEICFIEVKGTLSEDNTLVVLTRKEKDILKSIKAENYRYVVYRAIIDEKKVDLHLYETDSSQVISYFDPQHIRSDVLEGPTADGGITLQPIPKKLEKTPE